MKRLYIEKIHIDKVRHLKDIDIPLHDDESHEMRHLILTGRNGSGKTSLLEAIKGYLNSVSTTNDPYEAEKNLNQDIKTLSFQKQNGYSENEIADTEKRIKSYKNRIASAKHGIDLTFNCAKNGMKAAFEKGSYILAYFGAHREFKAEEPKEIKKIPIKDAYAISDNPRALFLSYMLDLKMTQALALANGNSEKASVISHWFDKIQSILRDIYEDDTLTLEFNEENYQFTIHEKNREPFDFNTASDGFSAILDIIINLIMRMQEQDKRVVEFTKPGIVLVDEIENHLHLEMQKRVLKYLTDLFPNVQFIITTHSPFVLNSIQNAVIYDLENHVLVKDGLSDLSYSGVVEGYFRTDELSEKLENKYNRFKELVKKKTLTDSELAEIASLELYLDEIPDYLMLNITTEYKKLKQEFENRKDI